jgi:hypothetical protein
LLAVYDEFELTVSLNLQFKMEKANANHHGVKLLQIYIDEAFVQSNYHLEKKGTAFEDT